MSIGKLTRTEYRLLKEKIISEYKRSLPKKDEKPYEVYLKRFKAMIPLNLALGVIASIGYIYLRGWEWFFSLFLSGIVWITIISAFVSIIVPNK